jgi:uncharacterized membrane protein YkvA (DUF1232 family)/GNAT superfamily N-acetyltransferase
MNISSNTLTIRQARLEDCAAIAHLQVDSYRSAYADILPQEYLDHFSYKEEEQDWSNWFATQHEDEFILVAVDDSDHPIGYALGRCQRTGMEGLDCELVALHLRQDLKGSGVGSSLMKTAAIEFQLRGLHHLVVWVLSRNPSRGFYEHLDGQLLTKHTIQLGDDIFAEEVAYGWQIDPQGKLVHLRGVWLVKIRLRAQVLSQDMLALFFAYKDPRTPWYAKAWAALVVAYAASPVDLIPDFIPILGYLDDLVLIPLGVTVAVKLIPPQVMVDARKAAAEKMNSKSKGGWVFAVLIVLLWLGIFFLIGRLLWNIWKK